MKTKTLEQIQRWYLGGLLRGHKAPPPVEPSYIETDKRKQRRAMRELVEAGYIAPAEKSYVATSKAYDEITAEKPDLIPRTFQPVDRFTDNESFRVTKSDIEKCWGVPWSDLSVAEAKWVVTHPEQYYVATFNPGWPSNRKSHKIGDPESFANQSYSYNSSLHISNDEVQAEMARRIYNCEFQYIRAHNLAWGLQRLGLLGKDEGSDKLIMQHDGRDPFGRSGKAFGLKPEAWGDELPKIIASLNERISRDIKSVALFNELQAKILTAGGWSTFLQRYDALVKEEMEKPEKAEPEKETA